MSVPINTAVMFLLNQFHLAASELHVSYHDREYDGSHGGLEDPQQSQAEDLDEGEEVDLPEGNVSQVNQVGLMFRGHQKQLKTIHKLQKTTEICNTQRMYRLIHA